MIKHGRPLFALLAVLVAAGCNKTEEPASSSGETEKKDSKNEKPSDADKPAKTDEPIAPKTTETVGAGQDKVAAIELRDEAYPAKDLETYIGNVDFLGWTKDQTLYAVKVARGLAMGALGGDEAATLIEVYDPRTDRLVALFRESSYFADAEKSAPIRKSWDAAKTNKEWKVFADARGIALKPSAMPGGWKVKATAAGKLAKISAFDRDTGRIQDYRDRKRGDGLNFVWKFFKNPEDYQTYKDQMGSDTPDDSIYAANPLIKLAFVKGKSSWPVLRMKLPYAANDMTEGEPHVSGGIQFFASGSRGRVAIVGTYAAGGMHEENGTEYQARFYSRSLGPQSKIVGSKETVVRAIAALEAQGYSPTKLEIKADPGDKTAVYYRGKNTKAIAEALAKALGTEASELKKSGWLQLIVVAGK